MRTPRQLGERMATSLRTTAGEHVLVALLGIPHLLRHPVWRRAAPYQGRGLGVLLVPGFGCSDDSLALPRRWLRARGYRPAGARLGINLGCTTELVGRLERGLEAYAETTGKRVVLLGQSRGGWLARLAATRRPDLVRGLVMLGCPVLDPHGTVHGPARRPRTARPARRRLLLRPLLPEELVRTRRPLARGCSGPGDLLPSRPHRTMAPVPRLLCQVRRSTRRHAHRNGTRSRLLHRPGTNPRYLGHDRPKHGASTAPTIIGWPGAKGRPKENSTMMPTISPAPRTTRIRVPVGHPCAPADSPRPTSRRPHGFPPCLSRTPRRFQPLRACAGGSSLLASPGPIGSMSCSTCACSS